MNLSDLVNFTLRSAQLTFEGRLTRDPETRYLQSGKTVTKLSMAINPVGAKRDDGSEPDWLKVELWEDLATAITDSARKGDIVRVTGRLTVDRWTATSTGEEREDLTLKLVTACEVIRPPAAATAPAQRPAAAPPKWNTNSAGPGGGFGDEEVRF
jgi:single-strand DNA-binding protein